MIKHSKPLIDKSDIEAVVDVLNSGDIVQGRKVQEFESSVSGYLGVKFGVAVSTGTAAIHLALAGLGVGPGDEVIMPSFICTSPYLATLYVGAKPVVVDINKTDFNIDVAAAKRSLTRKSKAIILPHMFGMPSDFDDLADVGIPIVEDCAHAIGAKYKGRRVGGLGNVSICSFYATKMMTTGEGGMVLTDDEEVRERVLEMRQYDGRSLDVIRYNYKLTDFQAALGLSQFGKLEAFVERRRKIAKLYDESFKDLGIQLPARSGLKESVYYRYLVLLKNLELVRSELRKREVFCERPVKEPLPSDIALPNTRVVHEGALSLPIYPSLSDDEVSFVIESFRDSVRGSMK